MSFSASAALAAAPQSTWAGWRPAIVAITIGLPVFGLVFWPEIVAAVRVWLDSTAFNHCFLVLPVAGYIAWQRRAAIAAARPRPLPFLALLGLPVALAWLLAERVGVMEARQFLAMVLLQILFLSVLGPRTWAVLSAPLLYLFFLVPSGEFLTPLLQRFTAHFITGGLNILGIVNFSDGVIIQIPEGTFFVAEACAGLRFLIASIAFGTLYACTLYRSPLRRILFIGLSIVVPILANGVRALAIVAIAHWFGSQNAVATDHIFYGWLLFSIVTFLLILVGLPFREQFLEPVPTNEPIPDYAHISRGVAVGLVLVLLLAGMPRALASYFDRGVGDQTLLAPVEFPPPPGCSLASVPGSDATTPAATHANWSSARAYKCDADVFVLSLKPLPARIGARAVFGGASSETAQPGWELVETRRFNVGDDQLEQSWSESEFVNHDRREIIASAVWVSGRPAWGISGRIRQALNTFHRSEIPTIIARVEYVTSRSPTDSRHAIERFLQKTDSLSSGLAQTATLDSR